MGGELVVRGLSGGDVPPEIGGEELVGLGDGDEGSLQEVTSGSSASLRLGVAISDSGHLQEPLRGRGSDDTGSSRSRNESAHDGSGLTRDLARDGVRLLDVSSPVSSSDGDDRELGGDDGSSDGGSDLLSALDSKSDVSVEVSDGDEGLEPGSLSGRGLLLNGGDVHDLVLEGGEEEVDNLELLDGEGEEVDLLHGLDLSVLDESSKLGDGNPLLVLILSSSTPGTPSSSVSSSSSSVSSTSSGSSSSEGTSSSSSSVSHFRLLKC